MSDDEAHVEEWISLLHSDKYTYEDSTGSRNVLKAVLVYADETAVSRRGKMDVVVGVMIRVLTIFLAGMQKSNPSDWEIHEMLARRVSDHFWQVSEDIIKDGREKMKND